MPDPQSKSSPERARVPMGVAAVAILSILGAFNSYQVSQQLAQSGGDPYRVSAARERFAAAAQRLPPGGVVGYISDLPCEGCTPAPGTTGGLPRRQGGAMTVGAGLRNAGNAAFVGARYALAPRLVAPIPEAPTAEWALGNFSQPDDFAAFGAQSGFTMIADLGNGVVIYRRSKP